MTHPSELKKRIRWRKIILLSVVATLVFWIGLLVRDVLVLRSDVIALQEYFASLPSPLRPEALDLKIVQPHLSSIHENLSALRSHAAPLLAITPALGWLPEIGGDIRATPTLIDMALQFTDIGDRASRALLPLWPPPLSNGRLALPELVPLLQVIQPVLRSHRVNIDRAGELRQQIDAASLSPRVRSAIDRFDALYPTLVTGVNLLSVAPQLLGADRPRMYLILLQNEDELRASGGFISAAGRITLNAGEIVTLTVEDSYQLDDFTKPYGDPPAPLLNIMGSQLWLFRDSNWSPDFPTAANKAIELYTYTRGGSIDGVIALDQKVVEALIAGLGPLSFDAQQPPLTAANVRTYMQKAWAPSGQSNFITWFVERKNFIGRMMQAMLGRVFNQADQIQWIELGQSLSAVLRRHDLLIYFTDAVIDQPMKEAGWDGALQSANSDYLMIVDSNLGFNKANALIQEAIAYSITLNARQASEAELSLTYTHTGRLNMGCVHLPPDYSLNTTYDQLTQLCYWNYRRVLVPSGVQLIDATRHPTRAGELITGGTSDGSTEISSEAGKTSFNTLLIVGRGQRVDSHLRYALPDSVMRVDGNRHIYHLHVQKQSGAGAWPLTITIRWPEGFQFVSARPAPASMDDRSLTFRLTLDGDQNIEAQWNGQP